MPKLHKKREATFKTDVAEPVEVEAERPNVSDVKAEWEAYARAVGVDPDGLTKAEIIDAVG